MTRPGIAPLLVLSLQVAALRAETPSFTDITLAAGTGGPTAAGKTGGHGVMFADADGDGLPDLYVTMIFDAPMADLFYHNLGRGRFSSEAMRLGIDDMDGGSHGACWADLDNDGDYDLCNGTTWPHPDSPCFNNLFRNDGSGSFARVTPEALRTVRLPTRALLCFDMDGDGDLDLFGVTNYRGSDDPPGERNEVYRNDGGFRFTAVDAGDLATCPAGQGAVDTDIDADGDVDVIAANRTGDVNILQNDGRGRFTLVAPSSLGIRHRAGDGITAGDIDNDGDLDLLLAGGDRAALYLSDGEGSFEFAQGFSNFDGYMGGFADLDNDGDLDLVFAGDDRVYVNDGGKLAPGPALPVSGIHDPRGIAFADIDGDGDPDFAIGAKRSRNWLIRNDGGSRNRWLKVALVSPQGQAGAFGARVALFPAGEADTGVRLGQREARSNAGYLGQDDPVLHFGVGERRSVDVAVRFLDGTRVIHRSVATNQTITVRGSGPFLADRTGTCWRPFVEWRLENPSWEDNPFDLVATATFRHEKSGKEHTTPMFHDGAEGWRFRFSGTRTGEWTFSTSSPDVDLDGKRGTVTVIPHPDPEVHGFLKSFGSKWGWQGTERAFVPQLVMASGEPEAWRDSRGVDRDIRIFLEDHGFNGFHVPTVGARWFDSGSPDARVDSAMENPDPRTVEALELLIARVHAAGGFVHIWAWGDHQRRQTPLSLRGGPDGAVARRLERYLAARLGPLAGWSMGYGFDLQEWAAIPGRVNLVRPWHDRLMALLGWSHFLGGRMGPTLKDGSVDHAVQAELNRGLGYYGYEHHRPTYTVYAAAVTALRGRPVFSEDRFRIRVPPRYPDKDYDEKRTRRGLYHSTLAGGVANIWGTNHPGGWAPGGASRPYPHPEWIKTWSVFFRDRFTKDMTPVPASSGVSCLRRPSRDRYVFYAEDTAVIVMDLSDMASPQPGVAVDTKAFYREVPIGRLDPGDRTWNAPHSSDWAIAVGTFSPNGGSE